MVETRSMSVHGRGSCADRLHFSLDLMTISFDFALFSLRLFFLDQASTEHPRNYDRVTLIQIIYNRIHCNSDFVLRPPQVD